MPLVAPQCPVVQYGAQCAQQAQVVEHRCQVLPGCRVCDALEEADQHMVQKGGVAGVALQQPCIELHHLGVGKVVQALVEVKGNLHRHPCTLLCMPM